MIWKQYQHLNNVTFYQNYVTLFTLKADNFDSNKSLLKK